ATSSVDIATDKRKRKIIRNDFQDCTVIVIAHRIETILDSDVIAVLNKSSRVWLAERVAN
ncbi:hypothetical protein N431DRAFT_322110, partial [Stipitochalara longipes BDJ]